MIVGIDEAGRGCWAGPLIAAAVLLGTPIDGLADSKQLSRTRRGQLAQEIIATAQVGIGWVSAAEIDEIGLTNATAQAMAIALSEIDGPYEEIIIDGNFNYLPLAANVTTMIKADAHVPAVSAASIVAKVARDNYMLEMAGRFPQYQFDRHVGYGTRLHHDMLKLHGVSELHRLSYKPLKALLGIGDV